MIAAFVLLVLALALLGQSARSAGESSATLTPVPATAEAQTGGSSRLGTPPPSPSARLSLESQPAGATVAIDGVERGKTPLLVENLPAGQHLVALSMPDRQEWRSDVFLSPDETKRLEIALSLAQEPTPTPVPLPTRTGPPYPLAVMVENMVDARPQSGLARADIVYEALVEGGISRFMAVYVDGQAEAIGPVRSARPYFVYLAAEFNATYVNIGWSPQAYNALQATGITNLDEIRGDPGFWRVRTRYAPHNAYTSTDLLRTTLDRVRRITPGSLAGFRFREDPEPIQGPEAREISLVYANDYRAYYEYSPEDKLYYRYMDGLPHEDAETGEQVAPRNLVVQFVKAWVIDDVGRLEMAQVGKGQALYFRDGVVTEGSWHKPSYGDVTEWYDAEGNPVLMNPGKIWVQIIPPGRKVSY